MPSKVTRSGTNFRGFFPSVKNQRPIPWHSLEERAGVLLLEFSPEVLRYSPQPEFHLATSHGITRYTADYAADLRNGTSVLIEIKQEQEFRRPSIKRRLDLIQAALLEREHRLHLWDEQTTRLEPRFSLLEQLRPLRGVLTPMQFNEAQKRVEGAQPGTFARLAWLAGSSQIAMTWIAAGLAGIDLDTGLMPTSTIFLNPREMRHAALFA